MRHLLALTSLSLCAALSAQSDLRIAGFDEPPLPLDLEGLDDSEWITTTEETHGFAALRYVPTAGRRTLFFAHTTLDTSEQGQSTARAVIDLFPFLGPPTASWTTSHPAFANLGVDRQVTGATQLAIPPHRIVGHLQKYVQASSPAAWGPFTGSGDPTPPTILVNPGTWIAADDEDERLPWNGTLHTDGAVFEVGDVARRALYMAAHQAMPQSQLPGLESIADMVNYEYGYLIHVQAVAVIPPTGQDGWKLHVSPSVVMRRRSLNEDVQNPRWQVLGALRRCQSPFVLGHWVNFAGRGEWFDVEFGAPVVGSTAHFETTTGWVEVQQQAPFTEAPNIARYAYPANGVHGVAFFSLPGPTFLQPLYPDNNSIYWATVFAFDPLPAHLPY